MAQTTVKGVLMDETLGEAEPFATVRVFKAGKKEKPVAMFLTKEDGQFSQEVKGKVSSTSCSAAWVRKTSVRPSPSDRRIRSTWVPYI